MNHVQKNIYDELYDETICDQLYIDKSWEVLEEYSDSKQEVFEHFESYQSLIKMIEI